jgi:hypothetical protein
VDDLINEVTNLTTGLTTAAANFRLINSREGDYRAAQLDAAALIARKVLEETI